MKGRIRDKIELTYWNIDKYIKQARKHDKVNGIAISLKDIKLAVSNRTYVKRVLNDIKATGLYQYHTYEAQLRTMNRLYKRYKLDLDIHPQYTPPDVRGLRYYVNIEANG